MTALLNAFQWSPPSVPRRTLEKVLRALGSRLDEVVVAAGQAAPPLPSGNENLPREGAAFCFGCLGAGGRGMSEASRCSRRRGQFHDGALSPAIATLTVDARSLPAVDTARSPVSPSLRMAPSPLLPPPSLASAYHLRPGSMHPRRRRRPFTCRPPSPSTSRRRPSCTPPPRTPTRGDGSGKAGATRGTCSPASMPRVGAACDATAQVAADRRGHGRRRERDARDGELLLPGVTFGGPSISQLSDKL
ncbi:hypothetical protein B0H14DRAFT_3165884 [Mycena olivaceomarginata]|nr:hypothetical protein B0H14DRAFT_3165884 [Mycena olivaceomarginata]